MTNSDFPILKSLLPFSYSKQLHMHTCLDFRFFAARLYGVIDLSNVPTYTSYVKLGSHYDV